MGNAAELEGFPASHAARLIEIVGRWSVSEGELLAGLGFGPDDLADPDFRITVADTITLVERARALTGEPALGFFLGLQMSSTAHGYLGFAVMSAATLRDALALAVQYAPIRTTALVLSLEVTESSAAIVRRRTGPPRLRARRHHPRRSSSASGE